MHLSGAEIHIAFLVFDFIFGVLVSKEFATWSNVVTVRRQHSLLRCIWASGGEPSLDVHIYSDL